MPMWEAFFSSSSSSLFFLGFLQPPPPPRALFPLSTASALAEIILRQWLQRRGLQLAAVAGVVDLMTGVATASWRNTARSNMLLYSMREFTLQKLARSFVGRTSEFVHGTAPSSGVLEVFHAPSRFFFFFLFFVLLFFFLLPFSSSSFSSSSSSSFSFSSPSSSSSREVQQG